MSEIIKIEDIDLITIECSDWVKARFDLIDKYAISHIEALVFDYLYRHCFVFNSKKDNAWCGESDTRIAERCRLKLRTLQQCLSNLKQKKLILIENPGNGMRKIYVNKAIFTINSTPVITENDEKEREIERLKAELERVSAIAKRVEELEAAAFPNAYVQRFIEAKYIKKADIPRAVAELNDLYKNFMFEFGLSEMEFHFDYMIKELSSKKIKDVISYLAKAVGERSKQLASKPKQEKTPKISQNPNKKEDWLDRMQQMNQEPDADPEEKVKLQAELTALMNQIKPKEDPEDEEQLQFDF